MKFPPPPDRCMSFWASCKATADTPADKTLTADELVELIRRPTDDVCQKVAAGRAALAKGQLNRFKTIKSTLPVVSPSGTFYGRCAEKLEEHNGLLNIDFDHLDGEKMAAAWDALTADPHVMFCFRSPSGSGIKGSICVPVADDGTGHAEAFAAAERYFRDVHNLTLDAAVKDVSRLCYLSHDPQCHHNPHAEKLDVDMWAPLSPEESAGQAMDDALESCRISTIKDPPPPPPVVLASASGHTIGTPGNLVTIEGAQKAGKSALVSALLASAVAGDGAEGDFLGIAVSVPMDSFILHFDCEQSTDAHRRLVTTAVSKRAGLDDIPSQLLSFSLLRHHRNERWRLVHRCCRRVEEGGQRVGLIVLDGVADFIETVNDDKTAPAFVDMLHATADRLGALIVGIIHENPNGENGKTRGHLGSELWRKSQGCIGVKKGADGISTVWGKFLRDGDWPEKDGAYFRYDITKGMHVSCDDPSAERQAVRDRKKLQELEELALAVLVVPMRHNQLVEAIMERLAVCERTAINRIKEMVKAKIAMQMEGGSYARCK